MSNGTFITRAAAALAALSGSDSTVTKVASTTVTSMPTWVSNTFASVGVADNLLSTIETITSNETSIAAAVSELQDAILT